MSQNGRNFEISLCTQTGVFLVDSISHEHRFPKPRSRLLPCKRVVNFRQPLLKFIQFIILQKNMYISLAKHVLLYYNSLLRNFRASLRFSETKQTKKCVQRQVIGHNKNSPTNYGSPRVQVMVIFGQKDSLYSNSERRPLFCAQEYSRCARRSMAPLPVQSRPPCISSYQPSPSNPRFHWLVRSRGASDAAPLPARIMKIQETQCWKLSLQLGLLKELISILQDILFVVTIYFLISDCWKRN